VSSLAEAIRRLILRAQLAVITAAGITLVLAGLLSYQATAETLPPPNATATPAPTPSEAASPTAFPTIGPVQPTASTAPTGKASRIVIPGLKIDLPVVQAPSGFPYCGVAQYVKEFAQPGQPGTTVIGAHARTGLFLPIHDAAQKADNGASMVGLLVLVYTNDAHLYLYEIDQVRRNQTNYDVTELPAGVTQQLVITTSEDGRDDPRKIMVRAKFLYATAADPERANPLPHIIICS
jgi:sortase (surface protein transpeptidase)